MASNDPLKCIPIEDKTSMQVLFQFLSANKSRFITDWLITPITIAAILAYVWCTDRLIKLTPITFPGSVSSSLRDSFCHQHMN
ncbi:hypothetical protein K7432_008729 [Basidiobolus ranarum]|uniref:Uncharacterized protein n=1 Tax=Basidiobolus ranarum TaxID=34480 RepID=A0ABR2VY56_9FUNG